LPAVLQLKTPAQRRLDEASFFADHHRLFVGQVSGGSMRNAEGQRQTALPQGAFVVYHGGIRDNFEYRDSGHTIAQDRVFAALVTTASGQLQTSNHWVKGWIKYSDITPDYAASQTLQARDGAVNGAATVHAALNSMAQNNRLSLAAHRTARAPAAIRAWVESRVSGQNGDMEIDDLQRPMPASHGAQAIPTEAPNGADAVLDPQHDLGLAKISASADPNSFYGQFTAFLSENAANMPGTMAKDHELRNTWTGGDRARDGQRWLDSYQKDLDRAKFVAITGSNVVNIFVNRAAPTWAAYEANYLHHAVGFQPKATDWQPAQTLRNTDQAVLRIRNLTQPRPGEMYLFHGTSRANVFNIAKSGFDPEYVNYTWGKGYGKTGYGTAFTDQYAKALAYAPPTLIGQGQNAEYRHYVLVARVFVGHSHDAGDRARRTRGNLEMTQDNLNYDLSRGNKPRAQGEGKPHLGLASATVAASIAQGDPLHSTFQHRTFNLTLEAEQGQGAAPLSQHAYRDTSVVISDAIQMYPAYIIEATIPAHHMRRGRR
jgi:hypothetical protein